MSRFKYFVSESSSFRNDLLRGLGGMTGVRLTNMALVFISSIVLARSLGPEDYGVYVFIMSLIGLAALLSCLGFPEFLIREIAKYEQENKWGLIRGLVRKSHQLVIVFGLFLMLLVGIVSLAYAEAVKLDSWQLLLALPLILIIALANLRAAILCGLRRIVLGSLPEMIVKPIVFLTVILGLVFVSNATTETALVAQVGAGFISLAVGGLLLRKVTAKNIRNASIKYNNREWLSVLAPFMGMASVSYLNVEFINVFLGFSGTSQDVAIFRVAANVALIVAFPLTLIESVISPYITRLYHAGELGKLQKLTQVASLAALLASVVPVIALVLMGEEVIGLLYGRDYVSAYGTLVVIVIGYMIVNFVGLSMKLLYATEYHMEAFRISAYGAVLTVLLCAILIPLYGALGAGVVLGFGKALRAVLFVVESRRRLGIKTSLIW